MPKTHTSITPGIQTLVIFVPYSPQKVLCLSAGKGSSSRLFLHLPLFSLSTLTLGFLVPSQCVSASQWASLPSLSLQLSCPACSSSHTFSCYCKHLVLKSLSTCQFSPHGPVNLMAFYGLWLRVWCSSTGAKFNSYIHSTNSHWTQG